MNAEHRPAGGKPANAAPATDEARDGPDSAAEDASRGGRARGGPEPADTGPSAEAETDSDDARAERGGPSGAGGAGPDAAREGDADPLKEREDAASADSGDVDDVDDAEEVDGPVETLESLRAQLDEARGDAQHEREAALRARAEVENVRRRAVRDVEQAHRFGIEGLVRELLPVRDGLELGIGAAQEEGSTVEALVEGSEMTLRMLAAAFEKYGVVEVDPAGEDFDPTFHQAMSIQQADGVEPGKVIQVFQKGCLLHGRVVRPAMVIVSK